MYFSWCEGSDFTTDVCTEPLNVTPASPEKN